MKAVRYWAPNDIRYEEVPIPKLNEGEILVKIKAALTCGTDVKTFKRGHGRRRGRPGSRAGGGTLPGTGRAHPRSIR